MFLLINKTQHITNWKAINRTVQINYVKGRWRPCPAWSTSSLTYMYPSREGVPRMTSPTLSATTAGAFPLPCEAAVRWKPYNVGRRSLTAGDGDHLAVYPVAQTRHLLRLHVCVLVVHVPYALHDSQLEAQVVPEAMEVVQLGLLVPRLNLFQLFVEYVDLCACATELPLADLELRLRLLVLHGRHVRSWRHLASVVCWVSKN